MLTDEQFMVFGKDPKVDFVDIYYPNFYVVCSSQALLPSASDSNFDPTKLLANEMISFDQAKALITHDLCHF